VNLSTLLGYRENAQSAVVTFLEQNFPEEGQAGNTVDKFF
jgi:hypothetical protein